jgi:hypothetical protein
MRIKVLSVSGIIFFLAISALNISALDLKFNSGITKSPETFNAGDVVTFTVNFTSQGGTVTNCKITGGVDATQIYERVFASIPDGANRRVSFTWTAVGGSHTAWFELDPDHTCRDSDYGNNRVELAVSTRVVFEMAPVFMEAHVAVFKPDLVITEAKFTKDTSRNDKFFYRFKFKNQGGGCVSAFNWKMVCDQCSSCAQGRFAAVKPLCALKAGEEKTIYGFTLKSHFSGVVREKCGGTFIWPKYKKYNRVYLVVDYDEKVEESNETNNQTATQDLVWENECD